LAPPIFCHPHRTLNGRCKQMAGAKPGPLPGIGRTLLLSVLVVFVLIVRWCIMTYKLLPTILIMSIGMQVAALVSVPSAVFSIRWLNKRAKERGEAPIEFPGFPSRWTLITFILVCSSWYIGIEYAEELNVWKYAATAEVLSYAVLVVKVFATRNVAGLSAGKLVLDILALGLRTAAMSWPGIHLPRQAGNSFIRVAVAISLVSAVVLLGAVRLLFRHSYKPEVDTFSIKVPASGCLALAIVLRADIGHAGYAPDVMWTAALYLNTVSMMPQLQLIGENGGVVDKATSHHIALSFVSRFFGFLFWWLIKGHWFQGLSYTGWGILIAYYLQLLLLSNVLCYYLKAIFSMGVFNSVPIVCSS